MNSINENVKVIDTKDNKSHTLQELMIIEAIKKVQNPFINLTVQDIAKDLKIGENMAYTIFKREDFPSVNIGRCWKISLISYLLWKTQKRIQNSIARKKNSGIGSVYYNKERKNWTASYNIIDAETKQEKRVRKTFQTKEEAERYLKIIQYQKGNEIFIKNNSIPLFELMKLIRQRKLDTNQIGKVAYNRLQSTLNVINKSEVVHKDINNITAEELQDYFNTLTYYSNSYIKKIIEQFTQSFRYAMNKGFLLTNPMYDTIVPKSTRQDKVIRALDLEEQQRLTRYLVNSSTDFEPYRTALFIEMFMGLRVGEALALKKEDVDLHHNLIHINKTMTKDGDGKLFIGYDPKTKAGIRDVPIPKNIRSEIIQQLRLADTHKEGLLFVSNAGGYADPSNVNHVLQRICRNLGINDVTSHSLRHTFATRCIEAGMRAVALQRLMGHSDVSVTLNIYTSVFHKYKNAELEKVNNYYMSNEIFSNEPKMLENEQEDNFRQNDNGQQFDYPDYEMEI